MPHMPHMPHVPRKDKKLQFSFLSNLFLSSSILVFIAAIYVSAALVVDDGSIMQKQP